MKDDDLLGLTIEKLRWLRLPGMARALPDILEAAREQNLSALEVVSRIADEEKTDGRKSPTTDTEKQNEDDKDKDKDGKKSD